MKTKTGYSLVEIMVVLGLFSFLMLVSTQILILSIRSTNKSQGISRVKENLEIAVSVIERQLRNAKSVDGCLGATVQRIDYLDANAAPSSFSCVIGGADNYIASGSARLTNQNVKITSCDITCTPNSPNPPSVMISISGEDNTSASGVEKGKADIKTTILLRQY